ncbi:hypothetical protein B4902_02755 [Yersinia frederiksenii]|nr:hypothetical protein B4902_02755 [Yersinia frederiksenii]
MPPSLPFALDSALVLDSALALALDFDLAFDLKRNQKLLPTKIAGRMSRMDAAKGAVELGASQHRFEQPANCRRALRQ